MGVYTNSPYTYSPSSGSGGNTPTQGIIFSSSIAEGVDGVIVDFPPSVSPDLTLSWDSTNEQPLFINNDGAEEIDFTFRAVWDKIVIPGFPAYHYPPSGSGQLTGSGSIYFTDTLSPVFNVDLSSQAENLELFWNFKSVLTGSHVVLRATIQYAQLPTGGSVTVDTLGFYEVIT